MVYIDNIQLLGLSTIDLPIQTIAPEASYILKGASGLGPPNRDIILSEALYGETFLQTVHPNSREIVLRIRLNPNFSLGQTAADLREQLYGLLNPNIGESVDIYLRAGSNTLMKTSGYVKIFETVPFSKEPEVQITLACPKPTFISPLSVTVPVSGSAPVVAASKGTAPSYFVARVQFPSNQTGFTLTQSSTGQYMAFPTYMFLAGDILTINTEVGGKSARISRGGNTMSILYAMQQGSKWLEVRPGPNTFTINAGTWAGFVYREQYWGI